MYRYRPKPTPLHAKAKAAGIPQVVIANRIGRSISTAHSYLVGQATPPEDIAAELSIIESECDSILAKQFGVVSAA